MFRIGIIGAGWIAEKMCDAIAPFTDMEIYAIASRTTEKAEAFAAEHNIGKAYGSYEEMVCDPDIDLVYIATPHSHHYDHAMLALEHGKPVLVAVSTNDALAGAAENIGKLLARKHYYFVPFGQDDPQKKPTSIVAEFSLIPNALEQMLAGNQLQPLLL